MTSSVFQVNQHKDRYTLRNLEKGDESDQIHLFVNQSEFYGLTERDIDSLIGIGSTVTVFRNISGKYVAEDPISVHDLRVRTIKNTYTFVMLSVFLLCTCIIVFLVWYLAFNTPHGFNRRIERNAPF